MCIPEDAEKGCLKDYDEEICEYCVYCNTETIPHPGGDGCQTVDIQTCEAGFFDEDV